MKVSFVGLGSLGTAIAERVLAAGHELTVYNRTAAKAEALAAAGARVAPDVHGLLQAAPVCITVVSDDAALEAVAVGDGGVLAGAAPGSTLVDMSTVSVAVSARVAEAAQAADVRYLRAPVSGNPTVVRAGNLTIIVSGAAGTLHELRPLLEAIGPNVLHVGEGEQARVVKLAVQILVGGLGELLAEAVTLAEAGGVDPAQLLEVLGNSAVGSPFIRYKSGPLLAGDYSATFTTAMMRKDVDLVLEAAAPSGLDLPFTKRLRELLQRTIDDGHADSDFMALFLSLQSRRGGR
jgi:3-hydroxyisobutyrate dehydrogenase-like beta-hydroxyacid dehydrogenase